jgi:hypothetical protein
MDFCYCSIRTRFLSKVESFARFSRFLLVERIRPEVVFVADRHLKNNVSFVYMKYAGRHRNLHKTCLESKENLVNLRLFSDGETVSLNKPL